MIVSEETNIKAGSQFTTRALDYIAMKGKNKPVRVFDVIGEAKDAPASHLHRCDAFEIARAAYRNRDWDKTENNSICVRQLMGMMGRRRYSTLESSIYGNRPRPRPEWSLADEDEVMLIPPVGGVHVSEVTMHAQPAQ